MRGGGSGGGDDDGDGDDDAHDVDGEGLMHSVYDLELRYRRAKAPARLHLHPGPDIHPCGRSTSVQADNQETTPIRNCKHFSLQIDSTMLRRRVVRSKESAQPGWDVLAETHELTTPIAQVMDKNTPCSNLDHCFGRSLILPCDDVVVESPRRTLSLLLLRMTLSGLGRAILGTSRGGARDGDDDGDGDDDESLPSRQKERKVTIAPEPLSR
jgi:hypothetical protein